jgi:two-component system cell cycle response regulator
MRILIAEDSGPSRLALEKTLVKWGYEVLSCRDGNCAWLELQKEDAPRLAILDWMMPGFSGPELCRLVRQNSGEHYTYILLLTSRSQTEDLVEGMDAGADDYVTKPYDQHELQVRIHAGKRILDLHAQLLAAREALRDQAMRDALTALWNRRSILEILGREQARSQRQQIPVAIIMLDIDHFKNINDTHGHLAGDDVLREVAQRLSASVRPYDGIGRYGGEEFLIVLPGCDEKSLPARSEAMRAAISDVPMNIGNATIRVTASFGATVFQPQSTVTSIDLIRVADDALYDAKRAGRNRVVCRSISETVIG